MVKRCVVYDCGNSCKTEHRYCPRISEESDNRSRESSELRLSHPNDELASRHLRSAFRRQLLQHGSLTDGRIVGLRGEENKNSCTWHCPDNYAHTVMIPPPAPVSRRQRSVGGPVGVAVQGVRAASPIDTTDRHTHSRSRRKDRIVPSLKLLEYVYIIYKILVVVIFSFQSVVF